MKIVENFLPQDLFNKLQDLIIVNDFPWFLRTSMVSLSSNEDSKDLGYFTHSFYNQNKINSTYYHDYILPILRLLNAGAVVEVRANLAISSFYNGEYSDFHTDNNFKCKTAILYLNDCDGGTQFKVNNETKFVNAEKNKMVIVDSDTLHRGTTSHNTNFRYIINFNYFEIENGISGGVMINDWQ